MKFDKLTKDGVYFLVGNEVKSSYDTYIDDYEIHATCNLLAYENKANEITVKFYINGNEDMQLIYFYNNKYEFIEFEEVFIDNNWNESIYKDCKLNQIVDDEIVYDLMDSLPPIMNHSNLIQIGGAMYTSVHGKQTYITFKKDNEHWRYIGCCHARSSVLQNEMEY